jgi:hypothetical protein
MRSSHQVGFAGIIPLVAVASAYWYVLVHSWPRVVRGEGWGALEPAKLLQHQRKPLTPPRTELCSDHGTPAQRDTESLSWNGRANRRTRLCWAAQRVEMTAAGLRDCHAHAHLEQEVFALGAQRAAVLPVKVVELDGIVVVDARIRRFRAARRLARPRGTSAVGQIALGLRQVMNPTRTRLAKYIGRKRKRAHTNQAAKHGGSSVLRKRAVAVACFSNACSAERPHHPTRTNGR